MLIFMPKQSKTKTLKVNFIQWPTYRQKLTTEFLENISCSLFCSVSRNKTTKRDIFSLNFCRSNAFKSAVAICVFFSWVSFSSLTTLEQNYPKRNIDLLKAGGTCGKKKRHIWPKMIKFRETIEKKDLWYNCQDVVYQVKLFKYISFNKTMTQLAR